MYATFRQNWFKIVTVRAWTDRRTHPDDHIGTDEDQYSMAVHQVYKIYSALYQYNLSYVTITIIISEGHKVMKESW